MVGVTPSTTMADAWGPDTTGPDSTVLAEPFGLFRDHISLMHS